MPISTSRSTNVNNEHCHEFRKAVVSITFPCNSKNAIIFFLLRSPNSAVRVGIVYTFFSFSRFVALALKKLFVWCRAPSVHVHRSHHLFHCFVNG